MPCSRPERALDPRSQEKVRRGWVTVIGVVLALLGLLWFLQGVGVVGGSFMSGEPVWAIIGLILLVLAGRLLVEALRGNRS
jgi:uncharacterized integral membrane protein